MLIRLLLSVPGELCQQSLDLQKGSLVGVYPFGKLIYSLWSRRFSFLPRLSFCLFCLYGLTGFRHLVYPSVRLVCAGWFYLSSSLATPDLTSFSSFTMVPR